MSFVRPRLIVCALAVLVCQIGLLAAAPFAFSRVGSTLVEMEEATCTCGHGVGAECPMHKRPTRPAGDTGGAPRWCPGCGDEGAALLAAMTSAVGVLRPAPSVDVPHTRDEAFVPVVSSTLDVVRPPSAPPPRS